jgi:hypothetical protein
MTLSEFLKILYKYYGNDGQTADFVRGLFAASVDVGENYDIFPDNSLPQKLFNGNKCISKTLAKRLRRCLTKINSQCI